MAEVYSNKDYKRLGDRIRSNPKEIAEEDLVMLQSLRMTYKEPLAVIFNSIERAAYKVDKNCICTYRVKRIESIISKLLRYPEMQVNRAEDIAGCRCIMSSTEKAYELYDRLMRNQDRLPFMIKGVIHDYIKEPKESGYRSIHINAVLKEGDNRRIEIQIRGLEHHNWATLVEITDLLFGARLKEHGRQSNADLYEFHRLLSLPPDRLSKEDQYFMADMIIKYNYIERIGEVFARNYLDVRAQWNRMKLQRNHFFLVSIGSDGIPDFMGFNYFEEAEKAYFDKFVNNEENRNIVLTHLQQANFTKISIAYSNYFLTFNNTIVQILLNLSEAVISSYRQNKVPQFDKYYQCYLDILEFWIDKQQLEVSAFSKDKIVNNSRLMRAEWSNSIGNAVNVMVHMRWKMHDNLKFSPLHIVPFFHKKRMRKQFIYKLSEKMTIPPDLL
jgi:ppGpp synthetase/RelA/SpoT-type nucleotidyltranferase